MRISHFDGRFHSLSVPASTSTVRTLNPGVLMVRIAVTTVVFVLMAVLAPIDAGAAVAGKPFTETGCEAYSDSVARLYTAGLDRAPEQGGFEFWLDEYTAGNWDLPRMATFFTQSDEFTESYGQLSDDGFIRQLYGNVLDRQGDAGGIAFWNEQMAEGMTRGIVLLRFAESPENIAISGTTSPALGPFNEGLARPWSCSNPTNATGSSPADALPLTAEFTVNDVVVDYDGQLLHVVESPLTSFNSASGRCISVLGTYTPTRINEGNVSPGYNAPDISLIVDDQVVESTLRDCDSSALEAAGWSLTTGVFTTIGTGYAFIDEFFLPSDGGQTPELIVVGDPSTSSVLYFQAPISAGLPLAPVPPSGPNEFLDNSPSVGASFTIRNWLENVTWEGRITDVVSAQARGQDGGTCIVVVGEITPTTIENGTVTALSDAPTLHLLSRGRIISQSVPGYCNTDSIQDAGFGWIFDAEVGVGQQYDFFAEFFLPEGQTFDLQAVVVGEAATDNAFYFIPDAAS